MYKVIQFQSSHCKSQQSFGCHKLTSVWTSEETIHYAVDLGFQEANTSHTAKLVNILVENDGAVGIMRLEVTLEELQVGGIL